jgi:epoxyqueuosine reductase QueG
MIRLTGSHGLHQAGKHRWSAFADAGDPLFGELKKAVRSHPMGLPGDLLPGARTVIAYFLPFDPAIPRSNHRGVQFRNLGRGLYRDQPADRHNQ